MQIDMHYYGTYAMARAAGIPEKDAGVIAYAAQFVDDSTNEQHQQNRDKGLLYTVKTAHHPFGAAINNVGDHLDSHTNARKIWVPFHFFPGGIGKTLEEKILCVKDGALVNKMLDNHLKIALEKPFRFELLGICAHVYQDTFSHHGFSGIPSDYNAVVQDSIVSIEGGSVLGDIGAMLTGFVAEYSTNDLGHGAVATFPDKPHLYWECDFELNRPKKGKHSIRNNPKDFLLSLKKLHEFFIRFANLYYDDTEPPVPFENIEPEIKALLSLEYDKKKRCDEWRKSQLTTGLNKYRPEKWENQKLSFFDKLDSSKGISTNAYCFHQAAAYHRYYVLKDLLPAHKIAVF